VRIREVEPGDEARLGPLVAALGPKATPEQLRRRLARLLEDPTYVLWVADTGEELAGIMLLRMGWWLAHDLPHLQAVASAVHPAYRGSDVWPQLLEHTARFAGEAGVSQIWTLTGIDRPEMHERLRSFGMVATEMKFVLPTGPRPKGLGERLRTKTMGALRRLAPQELLHRDAAAAPSQEGEGAVAWWDRDQVRAFLEATREDPDRPIWILALATGLRRRELTSLAWDHVDLRQGLIHVPAAFVATRGRDVPVGPTARAALTALATSGRDGLVVDGAVEELEGRLTAACERAGVPYITLDGLGRTHGALLLAAGVPIRTVTDRLGHRRVAFTADTYAAVLPTSGADPVVVTEETLAAHAR